MSKGLTCNGEVLQFVHTAQVLTKLTPEQEERKRLYEGDPMVQVSNAAHHRAISINWLQKRGVPEELLRAAKSSPRYLALLLETEIRRAATENPPMQTHIVRDDDPPAPPPVLTRPR